MNDIDSFLISTSNFLLQKKVKLNQNRALVQENICKITTGNNFSDDLVTINIRHRQAPISFCAHLHTV